MRVVGSDPINVSPSNIFLTKFYMHDFIKLVRLLLGRSVNGFTLFVFIA